VKGSPFSAGLLAPLKVFVAAILLSTIALAKSRAAAPKIDSDFI
jgi:hypothetical protein